MLPNNIINDNQNHLSQLDNRPTTCPRDAKGRFQKGFSGNDRVWAVRKVSKPLAQLCREKMEEWAGVLDSLIQNERVDSNVRLAAIKLGFEYGFGKPLQGHESSNYETQDYREYINYLAREIHVNFNFREINILESESKIKEFIVQKIGNPGLSDKVFDDVLKLVGSCSFQNYVDKLNESGIYYKYYT